MAQQNKRESRHLQTRERREARAQRILDAAGDLDLPMRCASALLTGSERGGRRRFDLVIGADGLHSAVRRLTFGEERRAVCLTSKPRVHSPL